VQLTTFLKRINKLVIHTQDENANKKDKPFIKTDQKSISYHRSHIAYHTDGFGA
jgi:hypothetical protein